MAISKLLLRRGLSTNVPTLDVGEISYDIDTKSIRVGDGTSSPPVIYSNKTPNLRNLLPSVNWTEVLQTPRTLAGYGITDGQPLNSVLTKIANLSLIGQEGLLQLDINGNFHFVDIGTIESLTGILQINQGGTGASIGSEALANLGGVAVNANNIFTAAQIIDDTTNHTLTLRSSLATPVISPGLTLDRLVALPNGTAFSHIKFTTLDTGLNPQEAFKLVVSVDNHDTNEFSSHGNIYLPTAAGPVSALGIYATGLITGASNVTKGAGTINASGLYINNVSVTDLFSPIDTTISISNVVGLSQTIEGLVPLSGATMTGPLYLGAEPTANNQAATKFYVDSKIGIYTATPPVGDVPPVNPIANQLWWDSSDGNAYIYYNNSWVSFFSSPNNRASVTPPLQLYVNPKNPLPAQVNDAASWNSGIILNEGYNQLTISILFTQIGVMTVQRYVDQQGQVQQGTPVTLDMPASVLQVLNIGDGIPFGSFTIILQNESASAGTINNFNILLNV